MAYLWIIPCRSEYGGEYMGKIKGGRLARAFDVQPGDWKPKAAAAAAASPGGAGTPGGSDVLQNV